MTIFDWPGLKSKISKINPQDFTILVWYSFSLNFHDTKYQDTVSIHISGLSDTLLEWDNLHAKNITQKSKIRISETQ